jgi:sn-glycerol 3-phosphate transport system permease protein
MAEVLPAPELSAPGPALAPRNRARLAGRYAALVLAATVVLLPIYCALVISLQPAERLLEFPGVLLPTEPTFSTFRTAFRAGSLGRYLLNSAVVSLAITAGQVVTSILAAYAFAFLRFPAKRLVFTLFLATLMVPTEVTIVANYQTVADLGWLDSYRGLVIPFLAFAFGTFLLRQAFLGVPQDLRDAAALDGYGHWGFLRHVAVPLARPAVAALAVFSFLSAWNQYLWPLLITNRDRYRTVQIGLRQLSSANVDELNLVMAGTVIAALPIFAVLVVFQRHLIRGLTSGALKG